MERVDDKLTRPLRSLRVSVTDRCNLRCQYCMPEADYVWLPRQDVLSFEETRRIVGVFTGLGVEKVRLTGGEPLLRKDVVELVRMLSDLERVHELALTTNGLLLSAQARELKQAGLTRVTVSLDTLRRDRFHELSRRDQLDVVLRRPRPRGSPPGAFAPKFLLDTDLFFRPEGFYVSNFFTRNSCPRICKCVCCFGCCRRCRSLCVPLRVQVL